MAGLIRVLAVSALLAAVGGAAADEFRTWADKSGKFKIKAKFVSLADGSVTLESDEGKELEIPLEKLSPADQKAAKDAAAETDNPFKAAPKTPFKSKDKAAAKPDRKMPAKRGKTGAAPATGTTNWLRVPSIATVPKAGGWKVAVGDNLEVFSGEPKPAALPPKSGFFDGCKGVAVNIAAKRAALTYVDGHNKPAELSRLVIVDLESGETVGGGNVEGHWAAVGMLDDGKTAVLRRDVWGFGNHDRIMLARAAAGDAEDAEVVAEWTPHDDLQGTNRDIGWTAILSGNRIAVAGGHGRMSIWDAETRKPVAQLAMKGGSSPGISPDGQLLAFTTGKQLSILDLKTNKVIAAREMPDLPWPHFAWSATGKKLACLGHDRLLVWDVATGEQEREMLLLGLPGQGPLCWTSDRHVLLGNQWLVDVDQQVKLWQYTGVESATHAGGLTWFVVADGDKNPGAILPAQLPQPSVTAALDKALADPEFFIVKPGSKVSIDVSGVQEADQRDAVRANLEQRVKAAGLVVDADAPVSLAAFTTKGKVREVSYHGFGTIGFRSYNIQEYFAGLKMVWQGKSAWETSAGNIPGFIQRKEGETMEQVLKAHEKPNFSFYERAEIPRLLTKPSGKMTIGTSQVTTAGVQ